MASIPDIIIGHEKQRSELENDIASNNIAHAYLFSGPRHLGKMTIARWFAWQLLSQGMEEKEKSVIRRQVTKLTHPDVLILDKLWIAESQDSWEDIATSSNVPQQHRSKKRVRSDVIGIDDIRALQDRLYETSSSAYTCCIIRSVERMQDPAANAFLKILEEPPPKTVFLLTTQSQHALLPTLVSRTRVMLYRPVGRSAILKLLEKESEEQRAFISHLAQGAPGRAKQLIADPDALRKEKQLHAQAARFWNNATLYERLAWLNTFHHEPLDGMLLHLGLTLRESSSAEMSKRYRAYANLLSSAKTNTHKSLLLADFALALT